LTCSPVRETTISCYAFNIITTLATVSFSRDRSKKGAPAGQVTRKLVYMNCMM